MLKYHLEKGALPVLPGDYVYTIGTDHAHTVRAKKIEAVILHKDGRITVKEKASYGESEFDEDVYLTAEAAEEIAAKSRPAPPYIYADKAVQWMPIETWEPRYSDFYGVKTAREDGSCTSQIAYYDTGNKHKDEKGFYQSDRRYAPRIENVIAWIHPDHIHTEEWYDGKPLDFSYSGIEELDLSVRAYNCLIGNGFHLIRDVLRLPDRESIMKIRNMGRRSYEEIIAKLEEAGFQVDYLK